MMRLPAVVAAGASMVVACEPAASMAVAPASPMRGVADTARQEAVTASLAAVTATGRYRGVLWRVQRPPEGFIAMRPIAAPRMV
jgi:hypothetical protein